MKKRTHEEYVREVNVKNPNIEVVGEYVNSNTKIMHRCLIHNIYWKTTPSRVLQGSGCEKCGIEKQSKSKTRTNEEYVQQLKFANPNIIALEPFKTINDKISHHCMKHNITWNAIPGNVLKGCGCVECKKEKIGEKNSKPLEKYLVELQSKFPTIECIGDYKNCTTPVLHKCNLCGHEWYSTPSNILNSTGCLKCSRHLIRTENEYVEDLSQINPQIELIGEYVNMKTKALHRCKTHDYCWNVLPDSIMNGSGCPLCCKEKISSALSKTHDQFVEELKLANPDTICVGAYTNSYTNVEVQCKKCKKTWEAIPSNLLTGHGCPICHRSVGEEVIAEWLTEHDIEFIPQKRFKDCKDKKPLPFDFYIPSENVAIEYDGEQHFKPITFWGGENNYDYVVKHDAIKTKYCEDNNITLLRINYNDNIISKLDSLFI